MFEIVAANQMNKKKEKHSHCMNEHECKALNYRRLSNFCHWPKKVVCQKFVVFSKNVILLLSCSIKRPLSRAHSNARLVSIDSFGRFKRQKRHTKKNKITKHNNFHSILSSNRMKGNHKRLKLHILNVFYAWKKNTHTPCY